MNIKDFADMVQGGIRPVIEFREGIEDLDAYANAGMRARVVSAQEHRDGEFRVEFDYRDFEDFNLSFEKANYFDEEGNPTLTARQAGSYEPTDAYYFSGSEICETFFEVLDDHSLELWSRYQRSCYTGSYVLWLESSLDLRSGKKLFQESLLAPPR